LGRATAEDDEVLAAVGAGPLTKRHGLADSEVDGFVIVTDEAFARHRASGGLTFSAELYDYGGLDHQSAGPWQSR
jgi:hypothetical protein